MLFSSTSNKSTAPNSSFFTFREEVEKSLTRSFIFNNFEIRRRSMMYARSYLPLSSMLTETYTLRCPINSDKWRLLWIMVSIIPTPFPSLAKIGCLFNLFQALFDDNFPQASKRLLVSAIKTALGGIASSGLVLEYGLRKFHAKKPITPIIKMAKNNLINFNSKEIQKKAYKYSWENIIKNIYIPHINNLIKSQNDK